MTGDVFCLENRTCLDGHHALPRAARSSFRRIADRRSGAYNASRRTRMLGKHYEIVFVQAAYDPDWTLRLVGFGPCPANSAIKYFISLDC